MLVHSGAVGTVPSGANLHLKEIEDEGFVVVVMAVPWMGSVW